jgi:hypothetical protein
MYSLHKMAHNARPDSSGCASLPLLLGWTDPETGDELSLAMRGSGDFLSQLLEHGFTDLGPSLSPASVDGAGASNWMGNARVGANPSKDLESPE